MFKILLSIKGLLQLMVLTGTWLVQVTKLHLLSMHQQLQEQVANISCRITTAGQGCIPWFAPPAPVTGHLCELPPPSPEQSAVSPLLSLPASPAQSWVEVSDCQHLTCAQLPGKLGKQVYGALSPLVECGLLHEVGLPSTWGGGVSCRASRG